MRGARRSRRRLAGRAAYRRLAERDEATSPTRWRPDCGDSSYLLLQPCLRIESPTTRRRQWVESAAVVCIGVPDNQKSGGRDATDQSLNEERRKTDDELACRRADIED